MPLREPRYKHDQVRVHKYTDGIHTKYRITYCMHVQTSGLVLDADDVELPYQYNDPDDVPAKLARNICRARNRIYELAYCNQWDYFFTGTLSPDKQDRTDLDGFRRRFSQMIRDMARRSGCRVQYLLVPELHADHESWHVHGFLAGLPLSELHRFVLGDQMSAYIASKVRSGQEVYDWVRYSRSFGFCDLEPIASHDGACAYVTKYIRKAMDKSVTDLGKHLYYASLGLRRSSKVMDGSCNARIFEGMMRMPGCLHHEYGMVAWCDELPEWLDVP